MCLRYISLFTIILTRNVLCPARGTLYDTFYRTLNSYFHIYPPIRKFWKKIGIVTGGQYNTSQGCKPYPIPKCSHHVQGRYQECGSIVSTPECTTECESHYDSYYWDDKFTGTEFYYLPRNETIIKAELYMRGPVEAAFKVYTDFLTYKEGNCLDRGLWIIVPVINTFSYTNRFVKWSVTVISVWEKVLTAR